MAHPLQTARSIQRWSVFVVCVLAGLVLRPLTDAAEPAAEPCIPVVSEVLTGRCINVVDGDTIRVRVGTRMVSVRLEGIDAPESRQDHSAKAKQALSELVKEKSLEVHITGTDKYQRTLAIVKVAGTNVNERLVADGWAWQYDEYNCDPHLDELEQAARTEKRGLWTHENAVPPWEFRRLERERQQLVRERGQGLVDQPTPARAVEADPAPADESSDPKGAAYWLNTSTNVRHNTSCRYFKNTKKGRSCSKSDGKACGICGG